MPDKKPESKVVLEREYIIPLRKETIKVPRYKRVPKAIKTIKMFLVRHMKVYDRDLRKVKIDIILNKEMWFKGIKKPPAKIKIIAKKYDDGIIKAELANIPEVIKFKKLKEEKIKLKVEKEEKKKVDKEKIEKVKMEKVEEDKESKEKEEASKEESLKLAKEQAREFKHVSKVKEEKIHRKALAK